MGIQEEAQRLKQIPLPRGEVREATHQLSSAINTAGGILGQNATGARELMAALQQARSQLDSAYESVELAGQVLETVATAHLRG
jgi:hypothetical protein